MVLSSGYDSIVLERKVQLTNLVSNLGQKSVVSDASEEVPLAHVLGDNLLHKLLKEHLERLALAGGVTQAPVLCTLVQLALCCSQKLLSVEAVSLVVLTPLNQT